jgi:AcrR family transcriptional regulator
MAISAKERQRRWKARQARQGNKAVTVSMTPAAYAALQTTKKETGCNFSQIINCAVTGNRTDCEKCSAVSDTTASTGALAVVPDTGKRFQGKRKDGLKTQSQILISSLKLFAENGYNATSVEDIIEDVGIARRTFYLHFKGKKDLLSHIINKYQRVFTDNVDVLGQLTFRKSQSQIKSIAAIGIQQLLADQELRWFTKLMLSELVGLQDDFFAIVDSATEEVIGRISAAIGHAQKDGTVSERLDPLVATFCLLGGVKEIMFQHIFREREFDLAESISLAVDLFANGFFD